jgi:hypothetical protein
MSLSGEEQSAPMSTSGEEQSAPMSLSGEEQNAPMTVSDIELDVVAAPRVSRRAAVVRVVVGLVAAGVVVGAVWACLAPPIHAVIALTRDESDRLFLGAFLMAGLLGAVAVVAATLAWQWRAHRGPAMVGALAVGAMATAGVATGVGAALVRWRYGVIDVATAPVTPEHRVHYVIEAPAVFFGHTPFQIATTILLPAGVAALVYALCTLATKRDDLGAWPPVTDPVPTAVGGRPVDPSPPSQ